MEILCFYAGIAFAYTKAIIPLLFILMVLILKPRGSLILWFLTAIFYGFVHQWWVSAKGMPLDPVIPKAKVIGLVTSLPSNNPNKVEFQFLATNLNGKHVQALLQLSCYEKCPLIKAGQVWELHAKLKKPINLANPGGFNYVTWLSARHVSWVGFIQRGGFKLIKETESKGSLLAFREYLATKLAHVLADKEARGIVQALSLGVTSHLDKALWDLFRRTGTTHLMVISGAHIGLIAGIVYTTMRWLWSRISLFCLYKPAAQVASFVGFVMALIYALLAGFAPPAQRSLFAGFFLLLRHFISIRLSGWQAWRYALLGVLLYEPHAVLLPGFYLSFVAVAILMIANQRVSYRGLKKTFYIQCMCLLGLMPLTLYWFSYGAINGLIANLLAIPWVGFVIVPLSLISVFLIQWFEIPTILLPVKMAIHGLLYYLRWVDSFSMTNLTCSFTELWSPLAIMLGMAILLLLPIRRFYLASVVLISSAFFLEHYKIKTGDAKINILDVGQGLAVVVRTSNHVLVYDTGMQFYRGGDMGKLVMIPFLHTLDVKKLDKIIISHPDLDHRGGLASLEAQLPVGELIVDNPTFYHRGASCHRYPSWTWDGIKFRFFAMNQLFNDKNNSSCVLQIMAQGGSVLLTGDIEKSAEKYLVSTYQKQLASTLLVIPHHGSKTSSTPAFIKQVNPKYAVISAGFDNRYHFPHQQTLNTLKKQNILTLNTMSCGMVTINLSHKQEKPTCYRN